MFSRALNPTARLVSYNVQNLFDAVDDGGEYAEFTAAAGWTLHRYHDRLQRVERVLRGTYSLTLPPASPGVGFAVGARLRVFLVNLFSGPRPDLIALEEVESLDVVRTLVSTYLRGRWMVIGDPEPAGGTRVAVLVRRAPERVNLHRAVSVSVTGRAGFVVEWQSRAMVEVQVPTRLGPVTVVASHWKSQLGDEARSRRYREMEAELVATRVADSPVDADRPPVDGTPAETRGDTDAPVVVLGDLNHDGGDGPATYFYHGAWERLDQALLLYGSESGYRLTSEAFSRPFMCAPDGSPLRYDARLHTGYSDHLPLCVTLSRLPAQ